MHKTISMNTIFPVEIIKTDFFAMPLMNDYMERLKPNPDRDILLIVGDGMTVMKDLEEWYQIAEGYVEYDTMGVNYSPMVIPHKIQHYAAGDAHMPDMQKIARGLPDNVVKHAWNPGCTGFDVRWVRNGRGGWNGTSANLALKIGFALDYTRFILAGCPMDNSGNWYKPLLKSDDVKTSKDHRRHLWKWTEMATRPIGRFIRSMSGNTADLFGRPTRQWLNHEPEIEEEELNNAARTTH